ncbi:MAG TPA: class I SAM-dependent methyltransferase [Bryobacteraceae bacterium]|jgi:ubiquinone/menaquinone biosynthesis C-methylase UbiE
MALKSNEEWRRWGKADPLWAVSTEAGKQRGSPTAWVPEEFYATGENDWRDFFNTWRQYGVDTESCLEIGCGAGRMTKQLARSFRAVYATDVSEGMIFCAVNSVKAANIRYCLTDGLNLPHPNQSVASIFSTHVLQHLDGQEIVLRCFKEFFRVLQFQGSLMVHVPLYDWPGYGRLNYIHRKVHRACLAASDMLVRAKRRIGSNVMRGTAVNVRSLHAALRDQGFKDIEFRIFPTTRNDVLHSFVMARK